MVLNVLNMFKIQKLSIALESFRCITYEFPRKWSSIRNHPDQQGLSSVGIKIPTARRSPIQATITGGWHTEPRVCSVLPRRQSDTNVSWRGLSSDVLLLLLPLPMQFQFLAVSNRDAPLSPHSWPASREILARPDLSIYPLSFSLCAPALHRIHRTLCCSDIKILSLLLLFLLFLGLYTF